MAISSSALPIETPFSEQLAAATSNQIVAAKKHAGGDRIGVLPY
jgi:hypothetical protein